MDLRELETFRAVVEAGGIAKASQRLHRAQSSITARIQQLEASLGLPLFHREGRRLQLTAAGDVLLGYTNRLLSLAEEARLTVQNGVACGRVRLGAMESTAASRLPRPLADFHRQYPQVSVELHSAPSRELLALLQNGALDLAIAGDCTDRAQFDAVPLYQETLVLAAAANCSLKALTRDLRGGTILVFQGNGCAYRRRLEAWLRSRRVIPGRVLEFASYHAILASVAAGVGVSLIPQSVLDIYPQRDAIETLKLPDRFSQFQTSLIRPAGHHKATVTLLSEHLIQDTQRNG